MWETQVQSLDQEDSLEKEMATHSSTHAQKIPWMEKPGGLQSMGSQSWTRLSNFTKCSQHTCTVIVWHVNVIAEGINLKEIRTLNDTVKSKLVIKNG